MRAATLVLISAVQAQGQDPTGTFAPLEAPECGTGMTLAKWQVLNASADLTTWPAIQAWCQEQSDTMQSSLCAVGSWSHSSSWSCKCCELKCCVPAGATNAPASAGGAGPAGATQAPAKAGAAGGATAAPEKPSTTGGGAGATQAPTNAGNAGGTNAPASGASGNPPPAGGSTPPPSTSRPIQISSDPVTIATRDEYLDPECGAGYKSLETGCCTCWNGYKVDSQSGYCSECAEGFSRSGGASFICTNGQDGNDCDHMAPFPFGCNGGKCSKHGPGYVNRGRSVFPCQSCGPSGDTGKLSPSSSCQFYARSGADDGSTGIDGTPAVNNGGDNSKMGGCLPKGPRMMAPFPYAPRVNAKFSLVVVGCDISPQDKFIIIPSFIVNGTAENGYKVKENNCEDINSNYGAMRRLDQQAVKDITEDDNNKGGWYCDSCAQANSNGNNGMGEVTIRDITYVDTTTVKTDGPLGMCDCAGGANAGQSDADLIYQSQSKGESAKCPCDVLRQYRKLCWQPASGAMKFRKNENGEDVEFWTTVDSHTAGGFNYDGDKGPRRMRDFGIGDAQEEDSEMRGAARGAAEPGANVAEDEDACCEGLLLGDESDDPCIPLWLFLLIWLLLCCLLALLAFLLHKNMTEIEAEKNNLKFSNFTTDKELEDVAQAEGDDDDI